MGLHGFDEMVCCRLNVCVLVHPNPSLLVPRDHISASPLPSWLQRYLPLLQWDYGIDDSDVQDILRYVRAGSSSSNAGCNVIPPPTLLGKGIPLSQKSPLLSLQEAEERAEANRQALLEELDREEASKIDADKNKQKKKHKPKKKK